MSASHDHGIDHEHGHPHDGPRWLRALPFLHRHAPPILPADAAGSTDEGLRAVKVSLLILGLTTVFQAVIVAFSGSVSLLADTVHNLADASTALPLWFAFQLSKRPATRRHTYGQGRAEDIAGVIIVLLIAGSAVFAGYESVRRLFDPVSPDNLGWVAAAAVIGFLGNEWVAIYRTRAGRRIGSAALIVDGQHARADGLTSLAVLAGVAGALAGAPIIDPLVGLGITFLILLIAWDAARAMWGRLMDAVEPELVHRLTHVAESVAGEDRITDFRARWVGHRLHAELNVIVDEDLPTWESHRMAEEVRHDLLHAEPRLGSVSVHIDPCGHGAEANPHEVTAHHPAR